ncbi:MAG: hypothetical protein JRI64_08460, partial [Deltaproteobacteria bacterium]|nr:hypothetical protein [Deltaproteobacteria bacterium]
SDENQGFPIILITKHFGVMDWYLKEYAFARENISFSMINGKAVVLIDNQLLEQEALLDVLCSQSVENPDRIEMSGAIRAMEDTPEVKIEFEPQQ